MGTADGGLNSQNHYPTVNRVVIALCATAALLVGCVSPHPTDSEVEQAYNEHRGELEKLLKMAEEDAHVARIANNFTWLKNDHRWPREDVGLTPERWNEYRALFASVGAHEGMLQSRSPTLEVSFWFSTQGVLGRGSTKGIVYQTDAPDRLSDSLDHEALKGSEDLTLYKELEKNWYIFLTRG